jgi:hypothetical protein
MDLSNYKKYFNKKFFFSGVVLIVFYNLIIKSCSEDDLSQENKIEVSQQDTYKFGYNLSNYHVVNDTIRSGDSFGVLLEKHHLFYPKIHHIAEKNKRSI